MPPTPEELENLYRAGVVPRPDVVNPLTETYGESKQRQAGVGDPGPLGINTVDPAYRSQQNQMGPPDNLAPDKAALPPGAGGGGASPMPSWAMPGGPARVGTLTNTETDTTTTNAPLTPEEADLDAKRLSAKEDRQRDAIEAKKIAMRNAHYKLGMDMIEQKSKKLALESGSPALRANYMRVNGHLKEARASFAKMKIDPDRLNKTMTGTQHVLNTIADAMATLAEGLTKGRIKNNTSKMLQMAIDRDIAAQRSDMATKLQSLKLSKGQMETAWRSWRTHEQDLKVAGLDLVKMHLSASAVQAKSMAELDVMTKMLDDTKKEQIRARGQARPKVVTKVKVKKRQALMGGAGAKRAGKMNKTTEKDLRDRMNKHDLAKGALARVRALMSKVKGGGVFVQGVNPNTWAAQLRKELSDLAYEKRSIQGDKGPIRKDDVDSFAVMPATKILKYFQSGKTIDRSLNQFQKKLQTFEKSSLVNAYRTLEGPGSYKAKLRGVLAGGQRRATRAGFLKGKKRQ